MLHLDSYFSISSLSSSSSSLSVSTDKTFFHLFPPPPLPSSVSIRPNYICHEYIYDGIIRDCAAAVVLSCRIVIKCNAYIDGRDRKHHL